MQSRCTVCNHTLIDDINLTVLSGDYTLDELSEKFGPSRSAFHRHKRHLEKKMARTLERLENNRKQVSFLKLSAFLDHVQTRVEAAAADGDTDRVYKGSHIGSRLIHQINKMDVPLEPDTAYRLLSSPGLASSDSLLPAGPEIIADLHQALRDKTLAPCPPPEDGEDDEAAENQAEDQPDLEKDLRQLLAALETKSRRPQTAQAARPNQRPVRKKLRQQKYILNGKILPKKSSAAQAPDPDANVANVVQEFTPPTYAGLPERAARASRLLTNPSSLIPLPCRSNADASPPATAPKPERDKSATEAKRQRRLLRKMLRNQKHISKAKKLLQNLTPGLESAPPPATPEIAALLAHDFFAAAQPPENKRQKLSFEDDPLLEMFLQNQEHSLIEPNLPKNLTVVRGPQGGESQSEAPPAALTSDTTDETRNSELETVLPETGLLTDPCPLTTDPCLSETDKTENRKLEEPAFKRPKPPPPYDEMAARADELFEISHGYKRNNPPKTIPNRRRDEDFRSRSIFGDVKNVLKYM